MIRENYLSSLNSLFRPKSVALIGASRDASSMSGVLLHNLQTTFKGPIYPVNPHTQQIGSLRTYATVAEVTGAIDLAFIAVPSSQVLGITQQCIAKKIKAIVLITAGFSESGVEGKQLEEKLLDMVRASDVRLVGPNCMGVMNMDPSNPFNGSFGVNATKAGNIAICSQSGALGFVLPDYFQQWSLGISSFASVGNKIDVSENDLLAYWGDDPDTEVIELYLESFQDPNAFRRIARDISRRKPIIALKSGRTQTGIRAAGSHTAALASHDRAVDALFRQSGVIRAYTLQELLEITAVLACQPVPGGRRVAVLSDAGGPGVLCVDALEAVGLQVPLLSSQLQKHMRAFLPPETTVLNPIDLIGTTDAEEYRRCLSCLLESDEIDIVIVIYVARLSETSDLIASAIRETAEKLATQKVVLGVFMQSHEQPRQLTSANYCIPSFMYPESAARALAGAVHFSELRGLPTSRIKSFVDIETQDAVKVIEKVSKISDNASPWLCPTDVGTLLAAFGLPTPRSECVESADGAVAAFERIAAPVALKVIAPEVLHKSDQGGVALQCCDKQSVRSAYRRILESTPTASGVLVQEMIHAEHELLVGVTRDPQFGPLIAFGTGGLLVELAGDIVFRLAPLSDWDIDDMLRSTKAGHLLTRGFRTRSPGDVEAIKDLLSRVSMMVEAIPEINQIDFNPVLALGPGRGVCIVDARIQIKTLSKLG